MTFDPYTFGKTQAADAPTDVDRVMIYDRLSWTEGVTNEDYAAFFRGFTDGLSARLGYPVTLELDIENHGRDWYWIRRTVLLPDQRPPTPGTGDLWRELIDSEDWPEPVRAMCEERRQIGIARYGTPLQCDNGRDYRTDLLQELLDAAVYAWGMGDKALAWMLLDVAGAVKS